MNWNNWKNWRKWKIPIKSAYTISFTFGTGLTTAGVYHIAQPENLISPLLTLIGTLGFIILEQAYFSSKSVTDLTTFVKNQFNKEKVLLQARSDMYETATDLAASAKDRLLIIQRTPPNIFPTEGSDTVKDKENKFWNAIEKKIEEAKNGRLEVVYVFSIHDRKFKDKLNSISSVEDKKKILDITSDFLNKSEIDKLNIFSLGKDYHTNPVLVADDVLSIWISESETPSESKLLSIRVMDDNEAHEVFLRYLELAKAFDKKKCIEELKKLLDL
ncbi:MAG TPA: hypothetical protein VJ571_04775 [Candidatus Nitrosotalea sp.]|nr:hypothetical protein [Candidatus Nitrosotalea sp.]